MLIDTALDTKFRKMLDRPHYKHLFKLRPQIRRFVFDDDASHKVGRFSIKHTDLVCRHALDVHLPFPNTYIEIDQYACIEGTENDLDSASSPRLGFLFTDQGKTVYTLAGSATDAFFEPFIIRKGGPRLDRNINYKLEPAVTDKDYDIIKYILLVGQSDTKPEDLWDIAEPYINTYELELTNGTIPAKILSQMTTEGTGVFKRAFTALMLLNERVKPKYQHIAASRQFFGSKLRAIPAHHIVTIDLDDDHVRKIYDGSTHGGLGVTHALHDVRKHWVSYDLSSQCQHEWEPYVSARESHRDIRIRGRPLERQVCTHCGGRRTERGDYERGDRSKPKVVHAYKVKASKEKRK